MSDLSFADIVSMLGVFCLLALRVYAGWLSIPRFMPLPNGTSKRAKATRLHASLASRLPDAPRKTNRPTPAPAAFNPLVQPTAGNA